MLSLSGRLGVSDQAISHRYGGCTSSAFEYTLEECVVICGENPHMIHMYGRKNFMEVRRCITAVKGDLLSYSKDTGCVTIAPHSRIDIW